MIALDDPRQRLINYIAALGARHTEGTKMSKGVIEAAWAALTEDEVEAIHERYSLFVSPGSQPLA